MTGRQLAELLMERCPDKEVMILDSFNGGGYPRDINLGPSDHTITEEDERECGDCEMRVGEKVAVIGFGNY